MSKLFDPSKLLDELQSQALDPSLLDSIDERSIEKAPNFLDWVIAPQFLNTRILPKQIEIGAKLFADYCPRCSNPGYIDTLYDQSIGNIRDNVVFLHHGKCPKCAATRWDLITGGDLQEYNEMVGCLGQRSGKTKVVGLVATYILHRFLKIPNPLRHFNQPSGELLMGTFSALTAEQAEETLWESFKGFMDAAPWYQNYHKFLKSEGRRLGTELFVDRKSFVHYSHKQLLFHFTGSEDKKMRGRTRIMGAIDELGWFTSGEDKPNLSIMNADAVYTALSNSLSTMRMKYNQLWSPTAYDNPPMLMANVSSPSAAKDKIMRLLKDANLNPKIYAVHLPTWDANPDYTYNSLRTEYAHLDEATFMRDYGAIPPLAADPFLSEKHYIDKIAQGTAYPHIRIEKMTGHDSMGDAFKSAIAHVVSPDKNIPRMLTLDLGFKKNALALNMFSLAEGSKIKLDLAINITPEKGLPVNLVHFFENVTLILAKNFNIKHVFFDRWQSLDQVQRLRDLGIDARVHSLKYKEMAAVKGVITSQGVIIPKLEKPISEIIDAWIENEHKIAHDPIAVLGIQLLTTRDLGTRMLKPLQGDDDLFRAFSLGVDRMGDVAIRKIYSEGPRGMNSGHTIRALGTVRTRLGNNSGPVGPIGMGANGKPIGMVRTKRDRR